MRRPGWLLSLTQHGEKPPYLLKCRSSEGFIIGTVALAVFTDMFLYGVIVPVVPFALEERSHVEHDRVQYWVSVLVAVYGAALLVFSPICGWLADNSSSRRSPLLLGLLALLGATIMLNVGNQIGIWIVARILQGASAAVVWVVGLALLADTIPQEQLGQAMGYVSLGMSLGILIAPLLGGVVFEHGGYDAVFGMAYALVGVDIILRLLLVEKKVAARWDPSMAGRATESTDTSFHGQSAQEESSHQPSQLESKAKIRTETREPDLEKAVENISPSTETSTNPESSASPIAPYTRRRDRLPPIFSLLCSRRLLAALFGSLIQAAILTSFDSVLTIHAAEVFNFRSTAAALLFLALVIPTFFAPLGGLLSDKYGGRYFAAGGFLLSCPPFICLRFIQENSVSDKVLLCALLALIGFFLSFTFPPFMAEISRVVEAKEKSIQANGRPGFGPGGAYAQAYALFNVAFAGGCMVGPLLAGFIVQERGWSTMTWVMGLLDGVTAIPSFLYLGGWVFGKP